MHRLWRMLIIGIVCLAVLSPAIAEARARDIVKAHPVTDGDQVNAASAKSTPNGGIVWLPILSYFLVPVMIVHDTQEATQITTKITADEVGEGR